MQKVLVIYETVAAREYVARTCGECGPLAAADRMPQWRSSTRLNEPRFADETTQLAIAADVVVFTGLTENSFAPESKFWIERWISKREEREGAIVGIFISRTAPPREKSGTPKEIYLRQIALRAGIDYLSHVPRFGIKAMPDSLDVYNQRAAQMTSVLHDILQTSLPASFAR